MRTRLRFRSGILRACAAARGSRDLRSRVPVRPGLARRSVPEDGSPDRTVRGRVRGAGLVSPASTLPPLARVARALRRGGPSGDRRALPRVLVRARPGGRRARRGAPRASLSGGARSRPRGLARVRQPRLARPLSLRSDEPAALRPLRRGRIRETERAIQECLREVDSDVELPAPLEPLRPEDAPGVLMEPQTADIALPADRGRVELVRDWNEGEDWLEAADAGAAASSRSGRAAPSRSCRARSSRGSTRPMAR